MVVGNGSGVVLDQSSHFLEVVSAGTGAMVVGAGSELQSAQV